MLRDDWQCICEVPDNKTIQTAKQHAFKNRNTKKIHQISCDAKGRNCLLYTSPDFAFLFRDFFLQTKTMKCEFIGPSYINIDLRS